MEINDCILPDGMFLKVSPDPGRVDMIWFRIVAGDKTLVSCPVDPWLLEDPEWTPDILDEWLRVWIKRAKDELCKKDD